ncbi:PD-(D/E)XK nuclease family protein [Sphingomonas sp. NFX23]|uniref:PD-(D/E)XK nuclease family protein n=1 Tax=Sphingomonas sp. NFX23 TaxID=2819532 RepID=UPI003CEAD8D4
MNKGETAADDRAALRWFADRSDPTKLLARRYGQAEWRVLRPAIVEIFDLDRTHHFLRAAPSFLERVHERQITIAMRNALERDPRRRLENCQALMDACGADLDDPLIRVIAIEADDSRRRLDLAIHAIARSGRPRCLVVEAKFKAPLQPRQLERYRATVMVDYPAADQRMLRVVGSAPPADFEDRTGSLKEWQFMHWSTLLRRWQRALPDTESKATMELMGQIWRQK